MIHSCSNFLRIECTSYRRYTKYNYFSNNFDSMICRYKGLLKDSSYSIEPDSNIHCLCIVCIFSNFHKISNLWSIDHKHYSPYLGSNWLGNSTNKKTNVNIDHYNNLRRLLKKLNITCKEFDILHIHSLRCPLLDSTGLNSLMNIIWSPNSNNQMMKSRKNIQQVLTSMIDIMVDIECIEIDISNNNQE